jgi:hypothetical protein
VRSSCIVGLVVLAPAALAGCATASFPTGSGTATITWHSVQGDNAAAPGPPQPFAGTVAGIPVDGRSLPAPSPKSLTSLPAKLTLATWNGRFQGHAFNLPVTFNIAGLRNLASAKAHIDGTYGSQKVRFVAGTTSQSSQKITFHGTVGPHDVSGSVRLLGEHGDSGKATATFTVTG